MSGYPDWVLFFGRFHPVLVHLPIGILAALGILELLARSSRHKQAAEAAGYLLCIAVPLTALASLLGWMLSREGGYEPMLLSKHFWAGIWTSVLGSACAALYYLELKKAYRFALAATIIGLAVTSHYGGSLTHGGDHLTRYAPAPLKKLLRSKPSAVARQSAASPVAGGLDYTTHIQPLLDKYCVGCHGPEKSKADLRMDSYSLLASHTGTRPALVPGEPAKSELIARIKLPLEDEDHMPPEGKPQPSAQEIALLERWISQGASNSVLATP